MPGPTINLGRPSFNGRLRRTSAHRASYERRPVGSIKSRTIQDVAARSAQLLTSSKPVQSKTQKAAPARRQPGKMTDARRRTMHTRVLRRDVVALKTRPKRRRTKSSRQSRVLTGVAMALCACALLLGWSGLKANHKVEAQVRYLSRQTASTATGATGADTTPSEIRPSGSSLSSYAVAPNMPKEIQIPKLGVDARIIKLGTTTGGALGTPSNIFDAGWFSGSSLPGQPGAALIDGHVSGPTQHGVFYSIKTLVPGDAINIIRGDGKVFVYVVVTSKTYDADRVDMAAALTPIRAGTPGLNLITCTGKLDSSQAHFAQREVVFAALK